MDEEIKFLSRQNLKILTATGWRISRTGVSAASFGGDIGYLHGMMKMEMFVVAENEEEANEQLNEQNP